MLLSIGRTCAPVNWSRGRDRRLTARSHQGCLAANALLRIGVWPRSAAGGLLDEERGALLRLAAGRSRETDGEKQSAVPCGGLVCDRESITTGCPRKPVKLERCGMRPAFFQEGNPVKTSWMRDAVGVFANGVSIPEATGIDKKKADDRGHRRDGLDDGCPSRFGSIDRSLRPCHARKCARASAVLRKSSGNGEAYADGLRNCGLAAAFVQEPGGRGECLDPA